MLLHILHLNFVHYFSQPQPAIPFDEVPRGTINKLEKGEEEGREGEGCGDVHLRAVHISLFFPVEQSSQWSSSNDLVL